MPAFVYRTLGELRQELRVRLGFGATGTSQGANNDLLNSFLQNAQNEVYWLQDWKKLHTFVDKTVGVGQNQIDYPTIAAGDSATLNPDRLVPTGKSPTPLWVLDADRWIPMHQGINEDMWDTMDQQDTYPSRYELLDQILLWPRSDSVRTIRIWGIKALERFTQDGDRATVDDSLIALHALAHGKAHYGRADAPVYMAQWDRLKAKILGAQTGSNRVFRRTVQNEIIPKPVVV